MWTKPTPEQTRQIEAFTSTERLRRYRAVVGGHREKAVALYLDDAALASHLHAHLRLVEVILREQLHRALTSTYGHRWYITHTHMFGGNSPGMLTTARDSLGPGKWQNPGFVVAELMLGFWAGLLQSPTGGHHQQLWSDAFESAFNARTDLPAWTQHDAMLVCKRLNWARNRVNHCESVIFGFPQKGMVQRKQLRLPPSMIAEDCRRVIDRFDSHLSDWMSAAPAVGDLLAQSNIQQAWAHMSAATGIITPANAPAHLWQVP
ncbi:hypothetical protein ACXYX3_27685 (plasmid) [Mycobacterium sp. C3-094]